jgi:hypothetical protein
MRVKTIGILLLFLFTTPSVQAARLEPKEVKPVIHNGVKYIVPH